VLTKAEDALWDRKRLPLSLALWDLTSVEAENGELRLNAPEGTAIFELEPLAEKWASKIRRLGGYQSRQVLGDAQRLETRHSAGAPLNDEARPFG
jgi:hypothetical protein